jgi:hypothetical protein
MISRNAQGKPEMTRAANISVAAPPAARRAPPRASNRASPRSDQRRLADLKVKLGDADYMNDAILRIATVLSARLTLQ